MCFKRSVFQSMTLGAAAVLGLVGPTLARAELVYEEDVQNSAPPAVAQPQPAPRAEDRAALRQALGASEKAQATLQSSAPAPAYPNFAPQQPAAEVENLSKA